MASGGPLPERVWEALWRIVRDKRTTGVYIVFVDGEASEASEIKPIRFKERVTPSRVPQG